MRKDVTVNVVKDAEKFDTSENIELETKEENIIDIVEDGVEEVNAPITDEQTKELIEKAEFLDAPLTQEIEKRYKVKLIGQITQGQYLEIKEWLDDGAPTE
jgi:Mg/Co/Ni transporter MgtE